jgi:hypothetical protein
LAASGAPSIVMTWPLPVSATNPMPERVPAPPVQLTVHSMRVFSFSVKELRCQRNDKAQGVIQKSVIFTAGAA